MYRLFLIALVGLSCAHVLPHTNIQDLSIGSNDVITPCSTNISNVYLEIFLMIDVSTNMGATNLRQMALSLSSELSKIPIGTPCTHHTSQFAVITYADTATLVANMTQIKSQSDLASTLLNLTISNTSSVAGIVDAVNVAEQAWTDFDNCCYCQIPRVALFVFIGASMNQANIQALISNTELVVNPWDSVLTINWNPKDPLLTSVFNNISYPSFNLSIGDSNFYQDLTWAIAQSMCYCNVLGEQYQLNTFNSTSNKWYRSADCYSLFTFGGFNDPDNSICSESGATDAAITSSVKQNFATGLLNGWDFNWDIGLHRNLQNNWVWADFDGNDVPLGNYQPWAPGYNASSPGDCVTLYYNSTIQNESLNYKWEPMSCLNRSVCDDGGGDNCVSVICQQRACDADYDGCSGTISTPSPDEKKKTIKQIKQLKKKNDKIHKVGRRTRKIMIQ